MTDDTARRRPRVICHMVTSIDGRIVTSGWPDIGEGRREYERVHVSYAADAWMCGRVTMEPFAGAVRAPGEIAREAPPGAIREDFTAPHEATTFAIAIDPSGRLAWKSSEIDGDHVVAVLTSRVSDDYLEFLQERGVSYFFAGEREIDFAQALEKLTSRLGINTVMLEGGGKINGSLLSADLVDEISVLVAPVADGTMGAPSLFDVAAASSAGARKLELQGVERRDGGLVWLRYAVVQG
jgi:2,5-diamino-6-(ribosylamino)-4(3H)-pyrimidinone 5'-phosphate reductase